MKLILIRHGETIGNIKKIAEGHLEGKLSTKGKKQAKKVAIRLKNEKIDYIYSSDLARAKDTLKEIIKYHPNTPIKFDKKLREMDAGDFTGRADKDIDWNNPPKSVETNIKAQIRIKKVLDKIYSKHKNQTVLVVGHSFINKALITVILNESADCMKKYKQSNTTINIFEIKEDKKHIIHLLNCKKHLA